jgi:hypothetical protein
VTGNKFSEFHVLEHREITTQAIPREISRIEPRSPFYPLPIRLTDVPGNDFGRQAGPPKSRV